LDKIFVLLISNKILHYFLGFLEIFFAFISHLYVNAGEPSYYYTVRIHNMLKLEKLYQSKTFMFKQWKM